MVMVNVAKKLRATTNWLQLWQWAVGAKEDAGMRVLCAPFSHAGAHYTQYDLTLLVHVCPLIGGAESQLRVSL